MQERRRAGRKQRILAQLIAQLPRGSFQRNPYFPDLLNQPDLCIAPERGRTVVVFLYGDEAPLTWRSALAVLEDLIEVKIHLGRKTVTIGLDFSEFQHEFEQNDMHRLLENTFEVFFRLDFWKTKIADDQFFATVWRSMPRESLFHLWDMEKDFVQNSLKRFSRERYGLFVDKKRAPILTKKVLIERVVSIVEEFTGIVPEREPLIESVKDRLGSLSGKSRLRFDLMVRGPMQVPIQIVRVGRFGSRDAIRYLMSKARLMRYTEHLGQIEQIQPGVRPLLIVEGNLAGPDHDPFRYVRSLLSVGWEITSVDTIQEFPRMLG